MPDVLEVRCPKRLESPNALRGFHWSTRHRDSEQWQLLLSAFAPKGSGAWSLVVRAWAVFDKRGRKHIRTERVWERRRVTIVRQVPSSGNFILDADNLRFCSKPVNDALVRLGWLCSDSQRWLEQTVSQEISPDGRDYTVIRIERLANAGGRMEAQAV